VISVAAASAASASPRPALVVDGLSAGYQRGRPVLHDVSFAVPKGEWWAVVGPSGCGKTTLLRTILGVVKPMTGRVALPLRSASRDALGYVPQQLGLVRNLSVRENVLLGGLARLGIWRSLLARFTATEVAAADVALAEVGLAGRGDDRVTELSGGERRRVAIARAIIQRPQVLIADEFLAELDPITSAAIVTVLQRLRESTGMTILCVEHDLHAAAAAADRVIVMAGGRKLREVSAAELQATDPAALLKWIAIG
jgi:phosphonate transport system ATP-binding protein